MVKLQFQFLTLIKLTAMRRKKNCSLQCRFPFGIIVFHPGDIRNQVAKVVRNLRPILKFFWGHLCHFFGGRDSKFLTLFYKLRSPSNICQFWWRLTERHRTLSARKKSQWQQHFRIADARLKLCKFKQVSKWFIQRRNLNSSALHQCGSVM